MGGRVGDESPSAFPSLGGTGGLPHGSEDGGGAQGSGCAAGEPVGPEGGGGVVGSPAPGYDGRPGAGSPGWPYCCGDPKWLGGGG